MRCKLSVNVVHPYKSPPVNKKKNTESTLKKCVRKTSSFIEELWKKSPESSPDKETYKTIAVGDSPDPMSDEESFNTVSIDSSPRDSVLDIYV